MSRRTPAVLLVLGVCGSALAAPAPSAQAAPPDAMALLKTYSGGKFDDAVQIVAKAGDQYGRELRQQWGGAGRQWLEADPENGSQRLLEVAAFALETERLRLERNDWTPPKPDVCASQCMLDWAGGLFELRGRPDAAERAWWLAAIALAEGERDWGFIYTAADARATIGPGKGLAESALRRFPGDARFRLERALAVASRFNTLTEGATRSAAAAVIGPLSPSSLPASFMSRTTSIREAARANVTTELTELAGDPAIGAEARLRLGYVHWSTGHDDDAVTELDAAARQTTDPDIRYLAHFLLGNAAESRTDAAAAIAAYAAALDARPHSQSASLALAALELQRGNASTADDLTRGAFGAKNGDADPWRQFLYGHYPQLPALIADLRARVAR